MSPPQIRVLRGEPDVLELAALLAVIAAIKAAAVPVPVAVPLWNDPSAAPGMPFCPGPDAWRREA